MTALMHNAEPLILLLNKAEGLSSFKAVKLVKRHCLISKAGHTGTLDPLATGMLPICLDQATKFCQYLSNMDKVYEVTAECGKLSSTGDREGQWIAEQEVPDIKEISILTVLQSMCGDSEQIPPMYSAIKKDGQPLYKLARKGLIVERKPRPIKIHDIKLLSWKGNRLKLRVHCGKGTYIRTLVEDIAQQLNSIAYVVKLHRLKVGPFESSKMLSWEEVQTLEPSALISHCLPVRDALSHFPIFTAAPELEKRLYFGLDTWLTAPYEIGIYRIITEDNRFIGLGSVTPTSIKPLKLLARINTSE